MSLLLDWLTDNKSLFSSVIAPSLSEDCFVPIDISSENLELLPLIDNPYKMEDYIQKYLLNHNKIIAFGGYLEKRNLYDRSNYFSKKEKRNIHLGIDFWSVVNTPVHAIFDGVIHSFQNNTNFGDYGPTIIMEHLSPHGKWYSLYGHLNLASIQYKNVGQLIKKGECIGALGKIEENGNYAPHLHFQVIVDIQDYNGDYPGVCSEQTLNFYRENCPNPLNLFSLNF